MDKNIYLMLFKNTTDSIRAQRSFDENNFQYNIMPAPTTITGCCGTGLVFREDVYTKIKDTDIQYKKIYIRINNGFKEIE